MALIEEDTLYIWEEGAFQELISWPSIYNPSLSPDGRWIFFEKHVQEDHLRHEIWVVRTDGSDLHRLLWPEQLSTLGEGEKQVYIDQISWRPHHHQLVFNTQKEIAGPPGSWPSFDLYLLEMDGEVIQVAKPGEGGNFLPSPDGRYIAAATTTRISLFDLEKGEKRILLEFDPLRIPTEAYRSPTLRWDEESKFITSNIPPEYIYYPNQYAGEPEQIWRLDVTGKAELIAEVEPNLAWSSAVSLSPTGTHYFYYEGGVCLDGAARIIHLRSLTTGEDILSIPCSFAQPQWTPDGEHFLYRYEGEWIYGSLEDKATQQLPFLHLPTRENVHPPIQVTWINARYFQLKVRQPEGCFLMLGSIDGLIMDISSEPAEYCPDTSFRVPD